MSESEWLACEDPAAMLAWLDGSRQPGGVPQRISDRKQRLWVEACRDYGGRANDFFSLDDETGLRLGIQYWCGHDGTALPRDARAALLREIVGNPFRPVTLPWRCRECGIPCGPPAAGYYCVRCGSDEAGRSPWLTPTVLSLAQAAYEGRCELCTGPKGENLAYTGKMQGEPCPDCGRLPPPFGKDSGRIEDGTLDPVRLAILADALEEAGCPPDEDCPGCKGTGKMYDYTDWQSCDRCWNYRPRLKPGKMPHPLLAHLRSPGPHVRGCWAVDLILGND